MDEMKVKLSTGLMKSIVTRLVSKLFSEKLGCLVNVELNEISITNTDGKVCVHLNADANMANSEFTKLVKSVGLD